MAWLTFSTMDNGCLICCVILAFLSVAILLASCLRIAISCHDCRAVWRPTRWRYLGARLMWASEIGRHRPMTHFHSSRSALFAACASTGAGSAFAHFDRDGCGLLVRFPDASDPALRALVRAGSQPIAVSRDAVERGVDGWLRLRCEILVKERV
jgi:hypothetical protein